MSSRTSHSPTTLLLCRHGQSDWNQQGLIQGQAPEAGGLTEQGRWQAQQLGQRLQSLGVDALYTSDLLRARETAQIVGAVLGLPAQPDPRWREIDLGVWQGLTTDEVDLRWPPSLQIREQDLPRGEIGETFAAVTQRTLAAISDLDAWHPGGTVAVICHGGNVRAALLASKAPTTDGTDPRYAYIPNTSVTILQVNGAGLVASLFPNASHLDGQTPDLVATHDDEQR